MKSLRFLMFLFLVLFLIGHPAAQATQSKTYSFTSTTSANYTITGSITYTSDNASTGWYNPEWKYRQTITINKDYIGEELTDFPVLIRLNSLSDGARDDRHDLVFTLPDNTTVLSYEREDNNTIWVKVPTLTPTDDTTLYLYYGNPNAEDQAKPSDVWTNGYIGVWNFNQNPEEQVKDSSKNAHHSTAVVGGMNKNDSFVDGKIGKALNFDGSNDAVTMASATVQGLNRASVGLWYKPTALPSANASLYIETTTSSGHTRLGLAHLTDGRLNTTMRDTNTGSSFSITAASTATPPLNQWSYVVATVDTESDTQVLYLNGQQVGINTASKGAFTTGDAAIPTSFAGRFGGNINGVIDSPRLSSVARSSSWIKAEYANQSNSEDFLHLSGDVEQVPVGSSITLKKALPYNSLSSLTSNHSGLVTYQLSPDAGTTWYYYTIHGWKKTIKGIEESSSINDINGHITSLPQGTNQLLFKAYLHQDATFDNLTITYSGPGLSPTISSSITTGLIPSINTLFQAVNHRIPTHDEWKYWADRMSSEAKSFDAWLGAMQWQKLFGA